MGQRADMLGFLLESSGLRQTNRHRRPAWSDLCDAGLDQEVTLVYRGLGGVNPAPRVMPGRWDLQFDELAVELDEERHFNRYRAITLESDVYEELRLPIAEYREFCARYESECLTAAGWRGNWTNPSAEREFGTAAPER